MPGKLKRKILLSGKVQEEPEKGENMERGNLGAEACSPICGAGCLTQGRPFILTIIHRIY